MFFNFKHGDIVNTGNEIAVIHDVLRSNETDKVIILVRFVRNIGATRPYDTLEVTPEKHWGAADWTMAEINEFNDAVERRMDYLRKESLELMELALKGEIKCTQKTNLDTSKRQ